MLVKSVSTNISFKGKIIDSHGHLGEFKEGNNIIPASEYQTRLRHTIQDSFETTINNKTEKDEVTHVLVSNLNCLENRDGKCNFRKDEIGGNEEILEMCKNDPKLKPLAVCQTGHGDPKNIDNILTKHKDKFFGLKFHPTDMRTKADDSIYDEYMKLAEKHKLPCVFHSTTDGYSNPEHIIKLAERHPTVPVVLYHIDIGNNDKSAALDKVKHSVDNKKADLYVDLSWLQGNRHIATEAVEKIGANRVLFGTDAPIGNHGENDRKEYIKYVHDIKNDIHKKFKDNEPEKIVNKVFHDNSHKLFFENTTAKIKSTTKGKGKAAGLIAGALAVGTGIFLAIKNKSKNRPIQKTL